MTVSGDYYEVLGVPRDADTKAIKDAFRQLARRYHPDISAEPDAEQRFKEIAEAYGVLSDPAKRASYDAHGPAGLAGATAEDLWGGIDFAGIFGPSAAAFGSLYERLFGPPAAGWLRGQDVHLDLVISPEEVLTGGDYEVTIGRPGPCPQCAGSGCRPGTAPRRCPGCGGTGQQVVASRNGPLLVRQLTTCPDCQGRGRIIDQPCPACQARGTALREATVTIRIPPSIPEGATLWLAGHGMPSAMPGGPPGDAYVSIRMAGGSGQPDAARSGHTVTAGAGGRHAAGRGLIFASVLLAVTGFASLAFGIAAITGSHILIANAHYLSGALGAWGWIITILGAVQLLTAPGVWTGSQLARRLAVAVVGLNTIGQMFFIPTSPFCSLIIISADVVALRGLRAYGSRGNWGAA
jgi:molecular chaperone DnaJ